MMADEHIPTDPEKLPAGWTELGLARLMERFFDEELPAESTARVVLSHETSRRGPGSASRWVVPLSAVIVLICGGLLSWGPRRELPLTASQRDSAAVEIEAFGIPFQVEQVSFAGAAGMLAQRNEWRRTTEGYYEPQSGQWVEWSTEELAIEVEPVVEFDGNSRTQGL